MELLLDLDLESTTPLYLQAVEKMKSLISSGQLSPGTKLPSTRELSESLGISRCTASRTYDELCRLGLICTKAASGTFVSETHSIARSNLPGLELDGKRQDRAEAELHQRKSQLSFFARRMLESNSIEPSRIELCSELNDNACIDEQLPVSKWREMLLKASRSFSLSHSVDVFGHVALRKAISAYLQRAKGVECHEEQIALFTSTQSALDLISRILLDPGDCAIVENPGFPGARRSFKTNGALIHSVGIDESGLLARELFTCPERSKLLYTTPLQHDPLGVSMSAQRMKEVLDWASRSNAYVIEDDFGSEFRYGDAPKKPLQSMDKNGRVMLVSSFWKLMFPLLRLGFVVLPEPLVPAFRRARSFLERDFNYIEHEALVHFIEEGHLERHIRKLRISAARKRESVLKDIYTNLAPLLRLAPLSSGTHLILKFKYEDQKLLRYAAEKAGLALAATDSYYLDCSVARNEYLLPFAFVDEKELSGSIERFAEILAGLQ